jgi:2-methylcitrate dehydratase PrpD
VKHAPIAALLPKIAVQVEQDLTAMYPSAWPARLAITLRDGTVMRGESRFPRGNPENPVSTPELEEKFVGLVSPLYGDAIAERALAVVRSMPGRADMATAFDDMNQIIT